MKRYNTPHRSRVVKTRMTEEEYAEFAQRLSAYHMSQAEFIRQAITGAAIRPIITVSPINDELLAAVGKLTAEYGRIGGNLNQIARTLNEWHSPYPQLAGEVRAAVSDLAALKFASVVMIAVMLPCFLFAMYEKHGQPLEVVAKHIIQTKFIAPKERPYQTQNLYAVLERQRKLEKEVSAIAKGTYKKGSGKKKRRG